MSFGSKRVLLRFFIFALIGLLIEVFFTASGKLMRGQWSSHGHTSPLMMVDYGLLGVVLMPIGMPLKRKGVPLALRAVVYMVGIFFIEFVSGWLFDLCGIKIWDYSHKPLNFYGYITLTYAPFWYALGLGAEYLYQKVDSMAVTLLLGLNADTLLAAHGKK